MSKQMIDAGPNPEVVIDEVAGDLQVRGWETSQIAVQADTDDLDFNQQVDQVKLSCRGDLDLRLPLGSSLNVSAVGGDASIKFMEDGLVISQVHGDLGLRHVNGCQVGVVHGDMAAMNIAENLQVDLVHGDVNARHVSGDCILEDVNGSLNLQEIAGSIRAACKGTARLRLHDLGGDEYQVQADGNLYCYLPEDAGLRIDMFSEGHAIKIRMPDGSTTSQEPNHSLVLGDGEASMRLHSGGSIYLFVERPGWSETGPAAGAQGFGLPDDFGQQIAQQVESQIQAQMVDVTRRINEQMERLSERLGRAGFTPEETERIVEQARRSGERESARAQEKMQRAQEKLERKLEAHRRRAEQRGQAATDRRTRRQSWGFEWPAPPPPPAPQKPPVTEEERLMILRMLEQKKISLEEADRLLSALEGNE